MVVRIVSVLIALWLACCSAVGARPLDTYLDQQQKVLGVWVPHHEPEAKSYEVVVYTQGPPPTLTLLMASDQSVKVIEKVRLPGVDYRLVTGLMCSSEGRADDRIIAQFNKNSVRDRDGSWAKPENVWFIRPDKLSPAGLEGVQCLLQSEGHE
jgi:hypothetical protein